MFLSELREILSLYPELGWELYFADSAVSGPHDFSEEGERRRNIVRAALPSDGSLG